MNDLNGFSFASVTPIADCASHLKNASMQAVTCAAVRSGEVG
jgi:ribosomal protein S8